MRRRPMPYAAVRLLAGGGAAWPNLMRCRIKRLRYSPCSLINSGSGGGSSDRPPTGCDDKYWLVVMDNSGWENATNEQKFDCYIKTLAKVVGSEEKATNKICMVSCKRYIGFFGFGCKIDKERANKLEGLPGVLFVFPDDPENGADLFVNGQIVKNVS